MNQEEQGRNGSREATPPGNGKHGAQPETLWLCEVTAEPVPVATCLACARERLEPACDFTPAILRAMRSAMQPDPALQAIYALAQQGGSTILRVSSLTGCTRQAWYRLQQATPLEKPSRHWARLRGSIFHRALQTMAGKEVVAERRFVVSLQPFGADAWIAGQIDHYDPATGMIVDYKTINANGRRLAAMDLPKAHHKAQLWIYAWLLEQSGWPHPTAGQIIYLDMGAVRATSAPMPSAQGRKLVQQRLIEKAKLIVNADEGGPKGDPREAWQCRYCLFKQGCPDRDSSTGGNGKKS